MLLGMTALADVLVKVPPHRSLNCSKGVVRARSLARCSKEIISGLHKQGVIDAVVISVKNGNERRITNALLSSLSKLLSHLSMSLWDTSVSQSLSTSRIH